MPSFLRLGSASKYPASLWSDLCSFLDYSGQQFFETQEKLLLRQLAYLQDSPTGSALLGNNVPSRVSDFRQNVPLSAYEDYAGFLRTGAGAAAYRDATWAFTVYGPGLEKWVPFTQPALRKLGRNVMAGILLGGAEYPGDVVIGPGARVVYNVPPPPFLAGIAARELGANYGLKGVISPAEAEALEFKARIEAEFRQGLKTGVDVVISMSSILNRISERFSNAAPRSHKTGVRQLGVRGAARYVRARARAMIERRDLLPKDLWAPKSIVGWGLDTRAFSQQINEFWGRPPFEMYAVTEAGVMGLQYRPNGGMAFIPDGCFYEFIPESELDAFHADPDYVPRTALLDEVSSGQAYEAVITSFDEMPFVRYRTGHILRFSEASLGYGPEFQFVGRADQRIDIGGFTRIDEATVWKSIADCKIMVRDWVLRREIEGIVPSLHLYAELSANATADQLEERIHAALRANDRLYSDLEKMLGIKPLKVTVLAPGAFDNYYDVRLRAGADLMRRRPQRMNVDEETVTALTAFGGGEAARAA